MPMYLKAVALFYRSVLGVLLPVSGLVLGSCLLLQLGNWPPPVLPLLLIKLGTYPAIIYLVAQFRPHQYWFYRNLHVSPRQLWGGVVLADTLVFLGVVSAAHALTA